MTSHPPSTGMLVTASPQSPNGLAAHAAALTALDTPGRSLMYLLEDGVLWLAAPSTQHLRARGLTLFACASACRERAIPFAEQATFTGLTVLADILDTADRFQHFPAGDLTPVPMTENNRLRDGACLIIVHPTPSPERSLRSALKTATGLAVTRRFAVEILILGDPTSTLLDHAASQDPLVEESLRIFIEAGGTFAPEPPPTRAPFPDALQQQARWILQF